MFNFNYQGDFKYNKIDFNLRFETPFSGLNGFSPRSLCYVKSLDAILVSKYKYHTTESFFLLFTLKDKKFRVIEANFNPKKVISNNKNGLICFYDDKKSISNVINDKFESIKEIKSNDFKKYVEHDFYMTFDKKNDKCLYILSKKSIQIVDLNDGSCITKELEIDGKPCGIESSKIKLFVLIVNDADHEYEEYNTRQLNMNSIKNDGVIIIDKNYFNILSKIKLEYVFFPHGLYVDENERLWTFAFNVNEKAIHDPCMSIIVFNENAQIIKKFYVDHIIDEYVRNIAFFNNLVMICGTDLCYAETTWIRLVELK